MNSKKVKIMKKKLKIDKAIYLVDDATKTYVFLKRNLDWKNLDPEKMNEIKSTSMVIQEFLEMEVLRCLDG